MKPQKTLKTEQELKDLWEAVAAAKSIGDEASIQEAMNPLALEYYHMVIDTAERMAPKLKEVTADECASYGLDGLYDAIRKFDLSMGIQFRTFAPHRIRGAILDNIRQADWIPRLVRQRNTRTEICRQSFYKQHGYNPSNEEMAEMMGCSTEQLDMLLKKSVPTGMVSMYNKPRDQAGDEDFEEILNVKDDEENDPIVRVLRDEMFKKLMGHDFTKIERKIIYLVYYEGLTMKEVASQISFSESRISQMHGEIIRRLKQKVDRNPQYAQELEKMLESA